LAVEDETMPNSDPAQTDKPESAPVVPPDEASPQTDCFQVSRVSLIYRYLLLLALTLVGALLLSLLFPMAVSGRDYLIGGLLAIWALALLWYWAFLLSMPHRICLEGNESLVLHSLFRTKKIPCSEIAALRVSRFYQSYLRIITSRKKTFPMLNHVDGLHDLIVRIKRVNPNLETKGC
jgi:hypothetical protein